MRRNFILKLFLILAGLAMLTLSPTHVSARTLIVTNNADSGAGSLRARLSQAVDGDVIVFANPLNGGNTISLQSRLTITQNNLTLDATANGHHHDIVLKNAYERDCGAPQNGIDVTGSADVIEGLVIQGFRVGINLYFSTATGNVIRNNYVGTDATGTVAVGNCYGIVIEEDATGNTIGGTTARARNLISGNVFDGIVICECPTPSSGNAVLGNYIGTDVNGANALPNKRWGIWLQGRDGSNIVGGTVAGARNVISGNGASGIFLSQPNGTGNTIQGNYIGLDATGTKALGNGGDGITIRDGNSQNHIGGTSTGAGNVISANAYSGIAITDSETGGNVVQGNRIGTDASGQVSMGNAVGITLAAETAYNLIGGRLTSAANIISGNGAPVLQNPAPRGARLRVQLAPGTHLSPFHSTVNDVHIIVAPSASTATSAGHGLLISDSGTSFNTIKRNLIGVQADGQSALPNQGNGIAGLGGSDNHIISNVIAFNGAAGVLITQPAVRFRVRRNPIFQNGQLGLELSSASDAPDGVTVGTCAGSAGGNRLYRQPIIQSVSGQAWDFTVRGKGCRNARLDLYVASPDPSNYGEAKKHVGTARVNTNGEWIIRHVNVRADGPLTATETSPDGNTSEFSAIVRTPSSISQSGVLNDE